MKINSVIMPSFKKVKVDFSGLNSINKLKALWRNPPRIILTSDMTIDLSSGIRITIPEGFVSDGASIPRLLWFLPGFSPFGVIFSGGLPHDFAYQYGYLLCKKEDYPQKTETDFGIYEEFKDYYREDLCPIFSFESQAFFDSFLKNTCTNHCDAKIIPRIAYIALRMFGFKTWKNYRKYGPSVLNENSLNIPGLTVDRTKF